MLLFIYHCRQITSLLSTRITLNLVLPYSFAERQNNIFWLTKVPSLTKSANSRQQAIRRVAPPQGLLM